MGTKEKLLNIVNLIVLVLTSMPIIFFGIFALIIVLSTEESDNETLAIWFYVVVPPLWWITYTVLAKKIYSRTKNKKNYSTLFLTEMLLHAVTLIIFLFLLLQFS